MHVCVHLEDEEDEEEEEGIDIAARLLPNQLPRAGCRRCCSSPAS
eukprot:COSAG02_NODE_58503_length_277_cov_0.584270_2_plen_44_part_01